MSKQEELKQRLRGLDRAELERFTDKTCKKRGISNRTDLWKEVPPLADVLHEKGLLERPKKSDELRARLEQLDDSKLDQFAERTCKKRGISRIDLWHEVPSLAEVLSGRGLLERPCEASDSSAPVTSEALIEELSHVAGGFIFSPHDLHGDGGGFFVREAFLGNNISDDIKEAIGKPNRGGYYPHCYSIFYREFEWFARQTDESSSFHEFFKIASGSFSDKFSYVCFVGSGKGSGSDTRRYRLFAILLLPHNTAKKLVDHATKNDPDVVLGIYRKFFPKNNAYYAMSTSSLALIEKAESDERKVPVKKPAERATAGFDVALLGKHSAAFVVSLAGGKYRVEDSHAGCNANAEMVSIYKVATDTYVPFPIERFIQNDLVMGYKGQVTVAKFKTEDKYMLLGHELPVSRDNDGKLFLAVHMLPHGMADRFLVHIVEKDTRVIADLFEYCFPKSKALRPRIAKRLTVHKDNLVLPASLPASVPKPPEKSERQLLMEKIEEDSGAFVYIFHQEKGRGEHLSRWSGTNGPLEYRRITNQFSPSEVHELFGVDRIEFENFWTGRHFGNYVSAVCTGEIYEQQDGYIGFMGSLRKGRDSFTGKKTDFSAMAAVEHRPNAGYFGIAAREVDGRDIYAVIRMPNTLAGKLFNFIVEKDPSIVNELFQRLFPDNKKLHSLSLAPNMLIYEHGLEFKIPKK